MRCGPGHLSFSPRLPSGLVGLSFRMRYKGRIVHVEARSGKARYTLLEGEPLLIAHHGEQLTLGTETVTMDIPALQALPAPFQPNGRAPQSRAFRD
jgi:alpha,alpha-trehalose phosphorylase